MSKLAKSPAKLDHQRLNTTLYTSILLIIITFVVGAFSNNNRAKPQEPERIKEGFAEEKKGELLEKQFKDVGSLEFAQIFNRDSNTIDLSQLSGLITVLKSHDIGARFTIYIAYDKSSNDPSSALVARMVSVYRWLDSLRLPRNAYQVEGRQESKSPSHELSVTFYKDIAA